MSDDWLASSICLRGVITPSRLVHCSSIAIDGSIEAIRKPTRRLSHTQQTRLKPPRDILPCAPQVVQEVLLWSRAPMEVRRLCARKEELFRKLRGDAAPVMPPGTLALLDLLAKHNVCKHISCLTLLPDTLSTVSSI